MAMAVLRLRSRFWQSVSWRHIWIAFNGCDILISNQATCLDVLVDIQSDHLPWCPDRYPIRSPALVSWSISNQVTCLGVLVDIKSGHLPWCPGRYPIRPPALVSWSITNQVTCLGVLVDIQATCLGVLVSDQMTLAAHNRLLTVRWCFYQLQQLRTVRRALTVKDARTLAHEFIISRVDYCNRVFGSTSAAHLLPLQSVLNAAARLIVRKQKFDRNTASIRYELHWLPVLQSYHYKLCLVVYECLHRSVPS